MRLSFFSLFFDFSVLDFAEIASTKHNLGISEVNTVLGARGLRWGRSNVSIVLFRNTVGRFDKSIDNGFYPVKNKLSKGVKSL